jgi:hypothetical protein
MALELVETNPGLALCISCGPAWDTLLKERRGDLVERLLKSKRKVACGMLGFPARESSVKLLAKIEPEACSVPLLMKLRRALQIEAVERTLRHVPRISIGILTVALYWRWGPMASVGIFKDLAPIGTGGRMAKSELTDLLGDTHSMLTRQNLPIRPVQGAAALRNLHDRLLPRVDLAPEDAGDDRLVRARPALDPDALFPNPPFQGNEWITPISTPRDLREEGRRQHHCVGIMADEVFAGELFVYRILAPERATLSLEKHGNSWAINQLYAACNRPVSATTLAQVRDWLRRAQPEQNSRD